MSGVKNESITEEQKQIHDDISNEDVSQKDDDVDQQKLQELRAKLASKQKENAVPPKIIQKKKRSIEFGVVGTGQGGSRISESLFSLGYPSICFNTAIQDLEHINIPEENKYLLEHGIGGAAKDIEIGAEAAEKHRDGINQLVHDKLGDSQILLLCLSLGGGSGAGSCETMIDVLTATGKPVIVITVLPMSTDDAQTKSNAIETLSKLTQYTQNKIISNLIVVDNAKIETIFNDVGQLDFFKVSNKAIVEPIDAFNRFSAQSSSFKALDGMELAKILTDGEGLSIYGEMSIYNYSEDTAIAEAVINNLDSGLLASGFNLKETKYAGFIIVAHEKVWNNIPSGSINYAMSIVRDTCGSANGIFKGIYTDNELPDNVVKIYSIFSGLGLPSSRIDQLQKEAIVEMQKAKTRDDTRKLTLKIDTGTDEIVSQADKIRQKIKSKSSTFNKNFIGSNFKDLRKK